MMLSLGSSENELLARDVCSKLTKIMANDREDGEKIAIMSADGILDDIRYRLRNESLAKEIEKELIRCHPGREWTFKEEPSYR